MAGWDQELADRRVAAGLCPRCGHPLDTEEQSELPIPGKVIRRDGVTFTSVYAGTCPGCFTRWWTPRMEGVWDATNQ